MCPNCIRGLVNGTVCEECKGTGLLTVKVPVVGEKAEEHKKVEHKDEKIIKKK